MMPISKRSVVYISVSIAVFLWGVSFLWSNSILQQGFPVFSLMFFRMTFAAIVLSIISFSLKKVTRIEKKDWGWFMLLVFLEPFLYFIGETVGLKTLGSPTISSVIISTIPIFALMAGVLVYNERISSFNTVGITMTLPGILLIVFEKGDIGIDKGTGILFLLMGVFAAVGYSLVVKKLAHKYNSYTIVTYQHILGSLYFLPFFAFLDLPGFSLSMLNFGILKPLLFLSVLCSSLAFILFINSIKELGVARANIFTSMVPVISAFAAFMIGQDTMSIRKALGVIVVVTGVIMAQHRKKTASVSSKSGNVATPPLSK
ncbi:MAG: DMT family transporter [Bacteroidales bacterium]|jgi:drug/metabolite transporter (DMT)-like permease|nr:DMT family transporter [Bacteroidales bacterium]MDD3299493.1 DMT family transporter [Bacteroidales bacterium]MDD3844594.1 DMT family transporter [Bacteroidales bacterium]MDD4618466.1 DMT family transporter [Bacteroidales bacterium]